MLMTYDPFQWKAEDVETEAKYWLSKANKMPIISSLYDVLGGDQNPAFAVPATFVIANLVFKELPSFLIGKYVFETEPNIYLALFGIAMQVVASIPVVIHKQRLKKDRDESDDNDEMRGAFRV